MHLIRRGPVIRGKSAQMLSLFAAMWCRHSICSIGGSYRIGLRLEQQFWAKRRHPNWKEPLA